MRRKDMLKLYNTLGRKTEVFHPVNKKVVTIFTCGPSVYQRAHIGNFRTFLFEDILERYLEYSGFSVRRGMNFTDLEDKAIREAELRKLTLLHLTGKNIKHFLHEMKLLCMKIPDYLPKASESVHESVKIIERLLEKGIAYRHKGNVYFDPLKFQGFGKLYGLDMSRWPARKKRFHKDTYPGVQWNLGDFILWHGYNPGESYYWDTVIGKGRPSWNVQDPGMVVRYFDETLSVYCGGIDNLYRHHDYNLAILESFRPYPMARYWLHCNHLYVDGRKMSKSKGNILYIDDLKKQGYNRSEIRFFLIYGNYRERMNYSDENMRASANKLRGLQKTVKQIEKALKKKPSSSLSGKSVHSYDRLKRIFIKHMDNNLNVKDTVDGICEIISGIRIDELNHAEASEIIKSLKDIDEVLKVIF